MTADSAASCPDYFESVYNVDTTTNNKACIDCPPFFFFFIDLQKSFTRQEVMAH